MSHNSEACVTLPGSACERAKITPVPHVHDLRHTAAHLMADAGYAPQEAGAQLATRMRR